MLSLILPSFFLLFTWSQFVAQAGPELTCNRLALTPLLTVSLLSAGIMATVTTRSFNTRLKIVTIESVVKSAVGASEDLDTEDYTKIGMLDRCGTL